MTKKFWVQNDPITVLNDEKKMLKVVSKVSLGVQYKGTDCGEFGELDRLDFEVEADEREDQTLQVLNEIVEGSQSLGILALVNVDQGADLGGGEADVVIAQNHFQLLSTHAIRSRPHVVVLAQNLRVFDDALQL